MKRNLDNLKHKDFDILIIGGGIQGLFTAWDAALRGLSVALIDKGDFGGATSSNTLRIIHGGFRHIQYLDFGNTRRFIKEQRILMSIAPHLVRPMPVLIPLYESGFFTKNSFSAALKTYDLLGIGLSVPKNGGLEKVQNRVISRNECIYMIPGIEKTNLSSGFIFTDCQILNSERFCLIIASSAYEEGADLANYVEAQALITEGSRVRGAFVRDNSTGEEFEIRAKYTINSSGPWINKFLKSALKNPPVKSSGNLKALNVAINRDITNGHALGLKAEIKDPYIKSLFSKNSRYLFITPWKGKSLIGTEYLPSNGDPDNFKETRDEIGSFLDDINACYPAARLKTEDVEFVYGGYVPTYALKDGKAKLGVSNRITDHEKEDGLGGLFSARGSKYTEARIVARECVDLVIAKTGKTFRPSLTESSAPYRGGSGHVRKNSTDEINGGTASSQIAFAVKEEMARNLTDVLFRRLDLSYQDIKTNIKRYSDIMAKEVGWDDSRKKKEEEDVLSRFPIFN